MIGLEQRSFRALADPTRRDILMMLSKNEMTIAEVAENFHMTRAAIKKHLSILHEGELISVRSIGRTKVNTLNRDGMRRVNDWLSYFDAFWDNKLDTLKTSIEKDMQ